MAKIFGGIPLETQLVDVPYKPLDPDAAFVPVEHYFFLRTNRTAFQKRILLARAGQVRCGQNQVDDLSSRLFSVRAGPGLIGDPGFMTLLPSVKETTLFFTIPCGYQAHVNPADVAGGIPLGPDGGIDGTDFIEFINAFGAGCE